MCGLAGILTYASNQSTEESLMRMSDAISHRGPDASGYHIDRNIMYLAHRRLAIIDLSVEGNQPMFDSTGRYCLVFNGEIYNYSELKHQLSGYPFHSNSDSEVILAAFAKWGTDSFKLLKGMFAFGIWDNLTETLTLVRDRLGVKPLYYYNSHDTFCFASEIRSLLNSGLVARRLDHLGLYEYLSFQSTGVPGTIIKDVHQLRPGCALQICRGNISETRYWDITRVQNSADYSSIQVVRKSVHRLLLQSVERRMVSDVPVAAFLSGGIDSSAIVALMCEAGAVSPNTFTASFEEEKFDEAKYADVVASTFNTKHTTVMIRPDDFLHQIENALKAMDSPSGDGVNTYVISKAIRSAGIKVALSGLGGDELFAGYPTFFHWSRLHSFRKVWKAGRPLRKLGGRLTRLKPAAKADRIGEILTQNEVSIANMYPGLRRLLPGASLIKLFPGTSLKETRFEAELQNDASDVERFPVLSQMTIAELKGYTLNTLLKDTDQMSMAVSLEIREPFFDHELLEYVLHIPDDMKVGKYSKSLLVDSLEGLLPHQVVHRPKQGFLFPWSEWLKKDLRSFCETRLYSLASRSFISGEVIFDLWKRFLRGDSSIRWADIWLFVVLEYWLQHNDIGE